MHYLNDELLIKCHLPTLIPPQKKQFIYELIKRYLRFMPVKHGLNVTLLINGDLEQWLVSAPNSNKTMALKQSLKALLKSYFKC